MRDEVREAVRSRQWRRLLAAVRGGPFMGLQRALDIVGSPVLPGEQVKGLEEYCPLGEGAVQGLRRGVSCRKWSPLLPPRPATSKYEFPNGFFLYERLFRRPLRASVVADAPIRLQRQKIIEFF